MSHFSELDAVHRQRMHTRPIITEEPIGTPHNLDPDYNHCPEDQIPYTEEP